MGELGPKLYSTIRISRLTSRSRSFTGSYLSEEIVFNWAADNERIAAVCRDTDAMLATVGFAKTLNEDKKGRTEAAVYVIAPDGFPDICKIGVSTNPVDRLSGLQGAHWAPLSIYSLMWSPTRKAETVEQRALETAATNGKRLMGEWVHMAPDAALDLLIETARAGNIALCDSARWVKNWKIRLEAYHRQNLTLYQKPRPLYATK